MTRKVKVYKVRATNKETGRVDTHHDLSKNDLEWLKSMTTIKVDVLEISTKELDYESKAK